MNGFTIKLPPLRERGDDVTLLINRCLHHFRLEVGKEIRGISPAAMQLLTDYSWPGNVRELEAVLRQALLQTTGQVVLPEFLPDSVRAAEKPRSLPARVDVPSADLQVFMDHQLRVHSTDIHAQATALMERYVLSRVLQHTRGNQSRAAKLLGITRAVCETSCDSCTFLSAPR